MLIELLVQATKKTRISPADKGNHQGADHSKAGERESQEKRVAEQTSNALMWAMTRSLKKIRMAMCYQCHMWPLLILAEALSFKIVA